MSFTASGKQFLASTLLSGSSLHLCIDSAGNTPSAADHYAPVPCGITTSSAFNSDTSKAWFYPYVDAGTGNLVMVTTNSFYFNDPEPNAWENIGYLGIKQNSQLYYIGAFTSVFNVETSQRPKFNAGQIQLSVAFTTSTN